MLGDVFNVKGMLEGGEGGDLCVIALRFERKTRSNCVMSGANRVSTRFS